MNKRLSKILKRTGFYLTRFRRASPAELAYRLGQVAMRYRTCRLIRSGRIPCRVPALPLANIRTLCLPEFHGSVEWSTVERILSGFRFTLNADPSAISGCEAELRTRCLPPISSPGERVDVRALWEPARLQHVTILIAWLRRYPAAPERESVKLYARSEIMQWLEDNPFLHGLQYYSAMECGLRLPVFFYALKTLDNLSSSDVETILTAVFMQAWWIENNLSLFSSLGNHTVCEALGLVVAGGMFRETPSGKKWLTTGITLLEQELPRQVLSDGGPLEQTFGYHRFVLDIYWLAVDFLEGNNLRVCDDFKARLLAGEGFLAAFSSFSGTFPAIGDYDDGYALAPGLAPQRLAPAEQRTVCRTFAVSGYSVVKGEDDALLSFDHGPLGMPPLYNHGHADALAVTLTIAGIPFLVDSGTCCYNGAPALRRYFKGTRAHNTVTVDGQDQAVQLTGFVWGVPFSGRLDKCAETPVGLLLEGSHDGYSRLSDGVRHVRSILHDPEGSWLITDRFRGSGCHRFELNYHFHPGVALSEQEGGWLAEHDGLSVWIELADAAFQLHCGEEEPLMGWFSAEYGRMVPAPVLQAVRSGSPDEVCFETRITIV